MRVFIWSDVEGLTGNYHSGGGLVVIADSLADARNLVREKAGYRDLLCDAVDDVVPDLAIGLLDMGIVPAVFVFPDAGCC
jgi:hypothetical protein